MAATMLVRFVQQTTRVTALALKQRTFSSSYLRALSSSTNIIANRVYTEKHEWITMGANNIGTVGISDHAQEALGEIVYVQLPEVGADVEEDGEAGCVESVKAASDIYSPVAGKIVEVNTKLSEKPDLLNKSPFEAGWVYKMEVKDPSRVKALMDEESYREFVKNQ